MSSTLPISSSASRKTLATYQAALAAHGPSDAFWQPRPCFQPPPEPAVWEAARSLSDCVDALLAGGREAAVDGIHAAERAELLAWGFPIMSVVQPQIIRWRPIDETALPPPGRLDKGTFSKSKLDAMYRRDGWRCRFCGCPVVRPAARNLLKRLLPGSFRWTGAYGDHAGFFVLSGVADHVQPHSRGGLTTLDNLVTCCQPCNYGRGDAFVATMGIIDPRSRDPYPADGWDGLERVLSLPEPPRCAKALLSPAPNMAAWSRFAAFVKVPAVVA